VRLTAATLANARERAKKRFDPGSGKVRARVTVHMGTCGTASGAREVLKALDDEIKRSGVRDVVVSTSGCAGLCSREPMVTVEMPNEPPVKYADVTPEKMRDIFFRHVIGGKIPMESVFAVGHEKMG
jgi:NADP-reducing hydrogenase subunit HndB